MFDNADRITQFTSLIDGISDDHRDQLVDATHSYQSDEDYSYDQNGNCTNAGYVTDDNNYLLSDEKQAGYDVFNKEARCGRRSN